MRRGVALGPDTFDGFEERLGLQEHAFAAAEGPVVHSAVQIVRPVAQVVQMDFERARLGGPGDHAVFERSCKELRKDGEEVKLHSAASDSSPSGRRMRIRRSAGRMSVQMALTNGTRKRPPSISSSAGPP